MLFQVLYRYPDTGDRVTTSFIGSHEPFPGYWAVSEERALERLSAELTALLPPREDVRALDAGCGEGRLLGWLSGLAATITAVDPDPDRLDAAREVRPPDTEVAFLAASIADVPDGPFDLVLCSHVIQHVPSNELAAILRRLHEATKPDAVLALSYSRAPAGQGGFSIERVDEGGFSSRRISRDEFDRALRDEPGGALPVRLLDPAEVTAEAEAAGWQTAWEWTYHVLGDVGPAEVDRDELVNASPTLRDRLGRDQVTLLRRTGR